MARVGEVEDRDAALVPRLHHDVAARDRDERAVVGHAVFERRLRGHHLVIAPERERAVVDGEDRVGSPFLGIRGTALGTAAAAPLIGEEHLRAIVVERGRVPIREVRVAHRRDPLRVGRVADVEQQAVALARATGQTDAGEEGDVVTLRRAGARALHVRVHAEPLLDDGLHPRAERGAVGGSHGGTTCTAARLDHAVEQHVGELVGKHERLVLDRHDEGAARLGLGHLGQVIRGFAVVWGTDEVVEDARRAHDLRLLGVRERDLDDFDSEECRVGILVRGRAHAARQLGGRANARGTGDVDVHVVRVLRIDEQRMRVRATAGLHVADVARVLDVGDVEDADAAKAISADRRLHPLSAAVEAAGESFAGNEEEVLVHGDVALRGGADVGRHEGRTGRVGDVPHLVPVVAALEDERPLEGQVRVGDADELRGGGRCGDHAHVPGRFARIHEAGLESDARVGRGRTPGVAPRAHRGTRGEGDGQDGERDGAQASGRAEEGGTVGRSAGHERMHAKGGGRSGGDVAAEAARGKKPAKHWRRARRLNGLA